MYKNYFKRLFDFTIALIGLICLSPVFIIVTIGLYFANQGKPFFFQARPGLNERIFKIIKFKTMNDKTDANGNLLPDADRLTPIGAFVRKTSLDEIPQLINVLKGDMSLIGPRPLLVSYLELYDEFEKQRHHVRPGITGWAQVNGRNAISWTKKFELDVYYVNHISFVLDIKIFFLTIKNVLSSKDISLAPVKRFVDEKRERNENS
jgi:undecaprenyl phosphate N,N'-diacetylbacillosamine 1-phosphate transferase